MTISSALNLLIVGVLLVLFVVLAPHGIIGLVRARPSGRGHERVAARSPGVGKRFGGFIALDGIEHRGAARASGWG